VGGPTFDPYLASPKNKGIPVSLAPGAPLTLLNVKKGCMGCCRIADLGMHESVVSFPYIQERYPFRIQHKTRIFPFKNFYLYEQCLALDLA
jgi:hypothetical protein